MSTTLQSQALQTANQLMGLAQQLIALQAQIASANSVYTTLALSGVLNALPTAPVSTDGSLGTADGAINNAHPIDTRSPLPAQVLTRAISSNDLASLSTFMGAFLNLMTGAAVTQQGQAPGLMAKLTGG